MIYESAVVVRHDLDEKEIETVKNLFAEVSTENSGEVLVNDDWGVKVFAQPTSNNVGKGRYLYFMFKSGSKANQEIIRKLGINDSVLKSMIIKLGDDAKQEQITKAYTRPTFS